MLRSIEEVDKPAKRGKKPELQKDGLVEKQSMGQTPKKRKTDQAAPSQPQPKKQKKPARRLILQSSSNSDSEYVPPKPKNAPNTDSENESSDEEASGRGDTPLHSPSPEIPDLEFDSTYFSLYRVQSEDDEDEPITKRYLKAVNNKLDQLLSSSSSGAYSDAVLKALFSSVVVEHSASLTAAAKAIKASTSQCQQASQAVDASTKECKEATAKVDKLTLQSECSKVDAARNAIQQANVALHDNVNELLSQLQKDLAMENGLMDELARRTNQLKLQTHKLRSAHAEIDDLKKR
ncbi:protein gar2-like [Lactuca sativa]|uniref:protein gar2-like n=1 Tax=Lactuca sativa TaxID=4236 RepID=UPI000CD7FDC3|nr:protein gar2-like [Lactuca sativa]